MLPLGESLCKMIKHCAGQAARAYIPFLRSSVWVLLPIWILFEIVDQYFSMSAKLAMQGSSKRWVAQIGQLSTAITLNFIVILFLPIRLKDWQEGIRPYRSWVQIAHTHTWPLFVEGLRMTAYILLWSIAFIIPGIYKQVRYIFVPFVVLLDLRYQKGEVDALEQSAELTKGIFGWLLTLFLASFVVDIGFEMLLQIHPVLVHPAARVLMGGLTLLVSIYFYTIFYFMYDTRINQILLAHSQEESE